MADSIDYRAQRLFGEPAGDDYLRLAAEAANYIQTKRRETPHGLVWDVDEAWSGKTVWNDEISLYTGSAGVIHFFLQLDRTLRQKDPGYGKDGPGQYLADSIDAARYIIWRWNHKRDLTKCFSPWAYTTGWSGAASALLETADADPDPDRRAGYLRTVNAVADAIMADAKMPEDGKGRFWSTYPGIVGDGGTILFLLHVSEKLGRPELKEFAVEAGRFYLGRGEARPEGGVCYRAVDPDFFGYPQDYRDPNFPMGTAGIGYLLRVLYEASGDEAFLHAEERIPDYLKAVAVRSRDGRAALLPHALPYRRNLFYLSYCHGPAGTARYFYKRYLMDHSPEDLEWAERLAEGVLAAGAPEIHSRGFWYIHCFCCGTAGILNLFLGLYAATREERWLSAAKRCGRVLYGYAQKTELDQLDGGYPETLPLGALADGLSKVSVKAAVEASREASAGNGNAACERKYVTAAWYMAFDRVSPKHISAPIGFYDGAAGIASTLLQLESALDGSFHAVRSADDPFPEHM